MMSENQNNIANSGDALSKESQSPRNAKSKKRQVEIIETALGVFLDKGDQATIEEISKNSGASIGSIYHHFDSRSGLSDAVYLEALRRHLEPLQQLLTGEIRAQEYFRIIVTHHLTWASDHTDWARYLLKIRRDSRSDHLNAKVAALNGKYFARAIELLRQYAEQGEIRKMPRYLYPPLILGPCQELIRQFLGNPDYLLSDVVDHVSDTIWRGLKADK